MSALNKIKVSVAVQLNEICNCVNNGVLATFQEHFRSDHVQNSNRTQLWNLLKMLWKVRGVEGKVRNEK